MVCTDTGADPFRSSNGFCCAGASRSPSRRCAPTSEWRLSASGRTEPSPAPRHCCWDCLLGYARPPGCCGTNARLPRVRAPGMPSVSPLSSMRSRWCGGICGSLLRLYPHRRPSLMWRKSHCRCSIVLWIALPTQLERLYICMLRLLQCTKSRFRPPRSGCRAAFVVYYVSAVHTVGNHCGTTNVGTAVTIGPCGGNSVAEGMRVDSAVTVGTGVYDACTANGVPADTECQTERELRQVWACWAVRRIHSLLRILWGSR